MAVKFTLPLGLLGGVFLGLYNCYKLVKDAPSNLKLESFVYAWTGFWMPNKKFGMTNGGGGSTIACLAGWGIHEGVGKAMKVNAALGKAKVPIIRL